MAGIKLRMPPGEFWQFLGESLGANPTPVAYAELYTALQTGTVDGQDNPLVAGKLMKFYEVTSQFVLTSHVIGYDVLAMLEEVWDAMKPDQQAKFRAEADKAFDANAAKYDAQEKEAIEFFKKEGKQVYTPDQNAFRTFAQKTYVDKYGNDWPKGALETHQRDQVADRKPAATSNGGRSARGRPDSCEAVILMSDFRQMIARIERSSAALVAPARRERRGRCCFRRCSRPSSSRSSPATC